MNLKIIILSIILSLNLQALTVGEVPTSIVIDGDNGGLVKDSTAWNSDTLKDKVLVLFYQSGALDETDIDNALKIIENNL